MHRGPFGLSGQATDRLSVRQVFVLVENPHPDWRGGILFRQYPSEWMLCTAGRSGEPTVHGRQETRPTLVEIDAGFASIADDGNWFSGKGAAAALTRRSGAASQTD